MQTLPIDVQTVVCSFLTLRDVSTHFELADIAATLTDWDERADTERLPDLVDVFNAKGVCQKLARRVMRGEVMRRRLEREFLLDESMYARVMLDMSFGTEKWIVDVHVAVLNQQLFKHIQYDGVFEIRRDTKPVRAMSSELPFTELDFAKRVGTPLNGHDRLCYGHTYTIPGRRGVSEWFVYREIGSSSVKFMTREEMIGYFRIWSTTFVFNWRELVALSPEEFVRHVNAPWFKHHMIKPCYSVSMPDADTTISCTYWRMYGVSQGGYDNHYTYPILSPNVWIK